MHTLICLQFLPSLDNSPRPCGAQQSPGSKCQLSPKSCSPRRPLRSTPAKYEGILLLRKLSNRTYGRVAEYIVESLHGCEFHLGELCHTISHIDCQFDATMRIKKHVRRLDISMVGVFLIMLNHSSHQHLQKKGCAVTRKSSAFATDNTKLTIASLVKLLL